MAGGPGGRARAPVGDDGKGDKDGQRRQAEPRAERVVRRGVGEGDGAVAGRDGDGDGEAVGDQRRNRVLIESDGPAGQVGAVDHQDRCDIGVHAQDVAAGAAVDDFDRAAGRAGGRREARVGVERDQPRRGVQQPVEDAVGGLGRVVESPGVGEVVVAERFGNAVDPDGLVGLVAGRDVDFHGVGGWTEGGVEVGAREYRADIERGQRRQAIAQGGGLALFGLGGADGEAAHGGALAAQVGQDLGLITGHEVLVAVDAGEVGATGEVGGDDLAQEQVFKPVAVVGREQLVAAGHR